MILLEKNPAEDISNIQFIDKVFLKGKIVYSQNVISSYDIPDYHYNAGVSVMKYDKFDNTEMRTVDVSDYEDKGEITQTITREKETWSSEKFVVSKNLSCTKWHYEHFSDKTDIIAEKEGEYIKLTGTFKGKEQNKTFKIGDGLWYQMMDMAMPAFIASDEEEIVFYSIGTGNNRGAMGLGEFAAKKAGEEIIKVNGEEYDCNRYYEYFIKHNEKFIIRAKKNRNVIYKGKTVNILELANRFKGKYKLGYKDKSGRKSSGNVRCHPSSTEQKHLKV